MRPTARALIVTGLALLGLLGFAGAPADDEPRLPPIVILDTQISGPHAIDDDLHPAVAWSRVTGEGLAVWTDGRNHASRGTDIYGRRVGANGKPIGDDFRISGLKATADERRPAVAWNETARGVDIYGRYMETAGKPAGRDFRICGPSAVSEEIAPAVAWNAADNEFLVVWEDWRNSA
ncbi:MAG: hypothetical protein MUF10_20135, partial [Thermoanaerobaculaceae bacterium]|nr:hypothetical protein [Thermoanaerobaculaceae bacterium]